MEKTVMTIDEIHEWFQRWKGQIYDAMKPYRDITGRTQAQERELEKYDNELRGGVDFFMFISHRFKQKQQKALREIVDAN